jgi:hypothetical protein
MIIARCVYDALIVGAASKPRIGARPHPVLGPKFRAKVSRSVRAVKPIKASEKRPWRAHSRRLPDPCGGYTYTGPHVCNLWPIWEEHATPMKK